MIFSALLIWVLGINFQTIGVDELPGRLVAFATIGQVCKCTDDGSPCVCAETGEFCGCSDCDKVRQTPVKTRVETPVKSKRLVTRTIQDGWTYESRCSRNGCTTVRVPRMVTVHVEE